MANNSKSGCSTCGTPVSEEAVATAEFMPTITQNVNSCGTCEQTVTHYPTCNTCQKPSNSCGCETACPTSVMPTIIPPKSDCPEGSKDLFAEIGSTFTYPDSGQASQVTITNVKLTEGQPLSSEKYGTLYVFSILDEANGVYELENRGDTDPTLVGKQVPCGTHFWTGGSGSGTVINNLTCTELTKDFLIPAVGASNVAEVSSLADFQISAPAVIRLKSNSAVAYRYTVLNTIGTNQVELRNDGQGGPVGTYITADQDCDGVNDWCVEPLEGGSICEQAANSTGLPFLLGCDGGTIPLKLEGQTDKQVPAWDAAQGQWTPFLLPDVQACVNLVTCFQVAPWATCQPVPVFITTSDDQLLLDRAAEALLSPNADPLITICGDEFRIILAGSSVGNIQIVPTSSPAAVISYDENCQICVPADCCDQCNPQVEPPVQDYTFTGKFVGGSMILPSGILAPIGLQEYKFRIVWDGAQLLTNQYNAGIPGSPYLTTYDGAGANLGSIPANDDLRLDVVQYCNEGSCPLLLTHGIDTTFDIIGMNDNLLVSLNYHTFMATYPCDNVVPGNEIRQTQHQIVRPFRGPTRTSLTSVGPDRDWGVPTPATKTFAGTSGESERSIEVFPQQCLVATAELTVLMYVDALVPNDLVINFNSNIRLLQEII